MSKNVSTLKYQSFGSIQLQILLVLAFQFSSDMMIPNENPFKRIFNEKPKYALAWTKGKIKAFVQTKLHSINQIRMVCNLEISDIGSLKKVCVSKCGKIYL